jgi:hypothetical protein
MAKKHDPVHVDLLAVDLKTGVDWLHPSQKNAGKGGKLDEIRKRNRAKYLEARKRERAKKESGK